MKSKVLVFLLMLCIAVAVAVGSARAAPVLLDGVSSTVYYDADKTGGDSNLCWAASASNVLAWSGWGGLNTDPALGDGNNEDAVYSHLRSDFSQANLNQSGLSKDAWQWWFTEPGLGSYSFNDYYSSVDPINFDNPSDPNYSLYTDDFIQTYIGVEGYGTVLSIQRWVSGDIYLSHAITLWGYEDTNSDGTIDTIYATNSDDGGDVWQTYGLLIGSDKGSFPLYNDVWFLDGYTSNQSEDWWFITRLQGLAPYEELGPGPVEPVPEPATIFLLGSGLVGLFGIGRRKFMRG